MSRTYCGVSRGFEHFLRPVPYETLAAVAATGPVVIVNVSAYGCHALIITAGNPPEVIDLPGLNLDDATARAETTLEAAGSVAGRSQPEPDPSAGRDE